MITAQEYNLILQKCKEVPPAQGIYLIDDYIENLMLTVLDFQMHNVAVEKAISYYRDNRKNEIRVLNDLKHLLSKYPDNKEGNTAIAQHLWGNRHWTRVSLLRKLVAYFDSIGITTQENLARWANTSDFQRDFKGKIPGMGYAIYKWLVMRQGVETVKPDVHLRRFIESIIHHSFTDYELVDVLEKVANQLELKAYELDWRIWEHQRDIKYVEPSAITIDIHSKIMVSKFIDDDASYLNWVIKNSKGFVVNCERNLRSSYLYLHRATCYTIIGYPARGKAWTKDYIKICSLSKEELEGWARKEVGGELHPCGICKP